jgi:threonine aldolase
MEHDMDARIDLRSDTVTLPSQGMRQAMAAALVGDDQYGEYPSINALQDRVAALLCKEAALWLPSGTMANQVALRALTRPGADVVVGDESHAVWHEAGASAANAGVQFTVVGHGGLFTAADFLRARKPADHMLYPPTTLVQIENTHNRGGGIVFPQADAEAICSAARELGVATFLDGARLWNAAAASGSTVAALAEPFDLTAVALSKGLAVPAGSLLAGSRSLIERCIRYRRMFGGAMRQAGILAAGGLYALEHNLERLPEDHANAARMAHQLASSSAIVLDTATVQTNIIVFDLADGAPDAQSFVASAKQAGVLLFPFGARRIRVVTHCDVSREQCDTAAALLVRVAERKLV